MYFLRHEYGFLAALDEFWTVKMALWYFEGILVSLYDINLISVLRIQEVCTVQIRGETEVGRQSRMGKGGQYGI